MKHSLSFGRIVIDLKHQFFGKADPSPFVIAGTWSNEEDDEEVWVDHFRGHIEFKYSDLRDPSKFYITNKFYDPNRDRDEQMDDVLKEYKEKML